MVVTTQSRWFVEMGIAVVIPILDSILSTPEVVEVFFKSKSVGNRDDYSIQ